MSYAKEYTQKKPADKMLLLCHVNGINIPGKWIYYGR